MGRPRHVLVVVRPVLWKTWPSKVSGEEKGTMDPDVLRSSSFPEVEPWTPAHKAVETSGYEALAGSWTLVLTRTRCASDARC
ncbi:hypothetical protein GCM10010398_73860 [Streptomyces fimbriatus]